MISEEILDMFNNISLSSCTAEQRPGAGASLIFDSPVFHYFRLAELKVNVPKVVRDQKFLSMPIPLHFPPVCFCIKYLREDLCGEFENLLGSDRMESVFGRNWSQRIP